MGVCFMLTILKQFSLPNLKVASLLLCLAFVYGASWLGPGRGRRLSPAASSTPPPSRAANARSAPLAPAPPQTCGGCSSSRW